MAIEWYYISNGKKIGPVSWDDIRRLASAGHIKPTDLVWRTSQPNQMPAASVPGLFPTQIPVHAALPRAPRRKTLMVTVAICGVLMFFLVPIAILWLQELKHQSVNKALTGPLTPKAHRLSIMPPPGPGELIPGVTLPPELAAEEAELNARANSKFGKRRSLDIKKLPDKDGNGRSDLVDWVLSQIDNESRRESLISIYNEPEEFDVDSLQDWIEGNVRNWETKFNFSEDNDSQNHSLMDDRFF